MSQPRYSMDNLYIRPEQIVAVLPVQIQSHRRDTHEGAVSIIARSRVATMQY